MLELVAKQRLKTAVNLRVPRAADSNICVNDEVLMYREKPIAKWVGPYIVCRIFDRGKLLELDTGDRLVTASIDKIKTYLMPKYPDSGEAVVNEPPQEYENDEQKYLDKLFDDIWKDKGDSIDESKDTVSINEFLVINH